jgi:hypothetical protein
MLSKEKSLEQLFKQHYSAFKTLIIILITMYIQMYTNVYFMCAFSLLSSFLTLRRCQISTAAACHTFQHFSQSLSEGWQLSQIKKAKQREFS